MKPVDETTVEDFWRNLHGDAVKWRTATKKEHWCSYCRARSIKIGDRYLDTGEIVEPPWTTSKVCERHAVMSPAERAAENADGEQHPWNPREGTT